jgi:hypothetical protein
MDTVVTRQDWTGMGSPRLSSLSSLTLKYSYFILLGVLDYGVHSASRGQLRSYLNKKVAAPGLENRD